MEIEGYGEVPAGLAKAIRRRDYQAERTKEHRTLISKELRVGRFIRGMYTRLGAIKGFATMASVEATLHSAEYIANGSSRFRWYEIAALVGSTITGAALSGRENLYERQEDREVVAGIRGIRPESSAPPSDER